jgi:hypothetical protein
MIVELGGAAAQQGIAKGLTDAADAQATETSGLQGVVARLKAFNGTTWDRLRTGAAAVLSAVTQSFALLVTRPGDWSVTHAPAVNTVATISKAAGGAGVRHVCTSITGAIRGGTTAPAAIQGTLTLRDGATGAGTILWSQTVVLAAAVGAKDEVCVSGLNIVGSANTAMTLEFAAAGGANTFESVALTGYSVS